MTFEDFEVIEVNEPIAEYMANLWKKELIVYREGYQNLLPKLKQCKYVQLLFDSEEETTILCSDEIERVVFNNLNEETWDWEKFVKDFSNIKKLEVRNCTNISNLIFDLGQLISLELFKCELEEFRKE